MIARTWHGVTLASKADAYAHYLDRTGVNAYQATPGNRGVYVLRRDDGDRTHFLLVSLWESFDAIRAFAGDTYERAVYYQEDDEYLIELEPGVTHYEVVTAP